MKYLLKIFIIYFSYFTLCFGKTIKITNGEWQPYLSNYSYKKGLASHIIEEAFKMEGIKVKWGFFTWKRSYELAKSGEDWDASAVWTASEKMRKDFLVSLSVVETYYVFFYRKDYNFKWKKMQDIAGLRIGITDGYNYGKEFSELLSKGKIKAQKVSKDELNFRKLLLKRIHIFPSNPIVGYAQLRDILKKSERNKITHHPKKFEQGYLYLLISKKSSMANNFLLKFNSGLKKLKESGRIDNMYKDLEQGMYDKQKFIIK